MAADLAGKLRAAAERFAARDLAGAERLCAAVLSAAPRHPDALHLLGMVRLAGGKVREAVQLIRNALEGSPGHAIMLENLGLAYLALQDYPRAEGVFRDALKVGATHGLLFMRLALSLGPQGKLSEAEGALRAAMRQAPDDPHIHLNLGNLLAQQGRSVEALDCYAKVLAAQPDYVDAHYNIGTLLKDMGRLEEATAAYERALALDPGHVDACNNLGVVHEQAGRLPEAIECYRRVLALDPRSAHAHCNLCSAYRMQGGLDEANVHGERALEIKPDFVDALMNLANVRVQQCRFAEAQACYLKALSIEPANAELQFTYATLCLELGDFKSGWQGFQWRPARLRATAAQVALDTELPGDIGAKTVMLLGEQGLGDELFFLRFAPILKAQGARLICESDRKIRSLVERTGVFDCVISPGETPPRHDLKFLVGDLPRILLNAGQSTPMPPPLRLGALEKTAVSMRERLARYGPPPYVGLTWRAGTPATAQKRNPGPVLYKEVPLEYFAAAIPQVPGTLLALQRHPRAEEFETLHKELQRDVYDLSAVNEDLEEMLALLSVVDEYVGVSNTNMHLMAGLGKGARVLAPYPAEWRWMIEGTASPWFPGFVVYRQHGNRDWSGAVARLAGDLRRSLSLSSRGGL